MSEKPEKRPAYFWRKEIMHGSSKQGLQPEEDPQEFFRQRCEHAYAQGIADLDLLLHQGASEESIHSSRLCIFLAACGLLTFGRLDVIEDILNNVPISLVPVSHFVNCVRHTLPVPPELKGVWSRDFAAFRTWFQTHRERLIWSEGQGRFLLEGEPEDGEAPPQSNH